MLERLFHYILINRNKLTHDLQDYAVSLSVGIGSVFTLQNVFDWFVHTIGACASAIIVSVALYFVRRKIKKMFP